MAKNALSISLILFVIIACVLGGTTYYFKKKVDENQSKMEAAVKALPGKDAEIERLGKEILVLKSYLGQETASLEDITTQYNSDMKIVVVEGGAPAPAAKKPADENAEGAEGEDGAEDAEGGEGGEGGEGADAAAVANAEKPSYRTVIEFLSGKIVEQNALIAQIETLNQQITDLKEQVEKAKEDGKAAGVQETEEKYKTQIAALERDIEELNGRIETKDSELKRQLSEKKKMTRESNRQKEENDALKKQNRERLEKISELEEIQRQAKQPPAESKMGELVYVDPLGKQGVINLGKKDNLSRGITFSVYEPNNLTEYGMKGTIEVLSVSEEREAEVIIYNNDDADPISVGDVIYTPTWAPGFEEHFAIAGFIDIDGDNKSDLNEVIRLIEQNGGIVDAYQRDDGKNAGRMSGAVTSETSWIVLGRKPDEKSQEAYLITYTNMTKAADDFNTKQIQLNDLLRKMGYRPSAATQDFDVRPNVGSLKRVSTGSVSGLYSDENAEETPAKRTPPRRSAY